MRSKPAIDKTFLTSVILLVLGGFFIFSSASLGLLAREGISYSAVAIKQVLVGFVLGGIVLIIAAKIPFTFWKRYAFIFFILSVIACILVFVPKIGIAHGGARRWVALGAYSFQPAELLKLGAVMCLAAWIATVKTKLSTFVYGALPFFGIVAITGVLLLKQPDTGTFMVVFAALVAMFIAAGGRFWHLAILFLASLLILAGLVYTRPYLQARFTTFLDPGKDSLNSGYQIQQSLIAIGSGGVFGRGFGQSIQKFNFLPEPIGDSIFAVASEEFGFVGALTLILLFLFFAMSGYKIAVRTADSFGMLMVVGIVTLIISGSFINIGSMLGVIPLTGIPLIFVSHGGTAMLFALAEVGIVLNISKSKRGH